MSYFHSCATRNRLVCVLLSVIGFFYLSFCHIRCFRTVYAWDFAVAVRYCITFPTISKRGVVCTIGTLCAYTLSRGLKSQRQGSHRGLIYNMCAFVRSILYILLFFYCMFGCSFKGRGGIGTEMGPPIGRYSPPPSRTLSVQSLFAF